MNIATDVVIPPLMAVSADLSEVMSRLPKMGSLMVIGRKNGVTLERIGPVGGVAFDNGFYHIGGACHDASVHADEIAQITLNPGREIAGSVYPRMEFRNDNGDIVMAWVGMAGGPAFLDPLADLGQTHVG